MENTFNKIELGRVVNLDNTKLCVCPICEHIFIQPVRCAGCDSHFCASCIENWLFYNPNKCINCPKFQKMKPAPLLNTLLSYLRIRCSYFPKCEEIVKYDFLKKHEQICPHKNNSRKNSDNNDSQFKYYKGHSKDSNNILLIFLDLISKSTSVSQFRPSGGLGANDKSSTLASSVDYRDKNINK